jgi:hypothetical protein
LAPSFGVRLNFLFFSGFSMLRPTRSVNTANPCRSNPSRNTTWRIQFSKSLLCIRVLSWQEILRCESISETPSVCTSSDPSCCHDDCHEIFVHCVTLTIVLLFVLDTSHFNKQKKQILLISIAELQQVSISDKSQYKISSKAISVDKWYKL